MVITKIDISLLKENPDNPRTITDAKFAALVESVKAFPQMLQVRPIAFKTALDGSFVVLGGNMRLRACIAAGMKEVPVIDCSDLSEAQQREFVVRDNVAFGEWEWDKIVADWPEAAEWGVDIPKWVQAKGGAEEDDYEIPAEIDTDIVLGDLFEIGEHRLVCGSSTEADVVAKVLNGKEPYLMVTDPPYGVNYDPSWREGKSDDERWTKTQIGKGKVANDEEADWTSAWVLSPASVTYVYHGGKHTAVVSKSLEDSGFVLRSQIIWVKQAFVFSRGDYHWQHEPIWYAVKKGKKGNWAGDRKQSTVWNIQGRAAIGDTSRLKGVDATTGHGTQKPVECMARPIANHDGDVYDPFLGSGTTMVAAHQLNRKCYGIELDPKYCQVIVDRMRKLAPELPIKKNGVPLDVTDEKQTNGIPK